MTFEDAIPIREYARLNGCDDKIIRRAIEKGMIPESALVINEKNGRPMIIPSKADAAWGIDYREKKEVVKPDPSSVRKTKSRKTVPVAPAVEKPVEKYPDQDPEVPEEMKDDDGMPIVRVNMNLNQATTANKILEAMTQKVKLRKMNGELVEVDLVHKALFLYGQEIRSELQNIPERIIDDLLASTSRNKGYLLLSAAIDKALEKLSKPPKIS